MLILVDVFGGDSAPDQIIKGALDAIRQKDGFSLGLVGKEKEINNILAKLEYDKERVNVYNASEIITCEEEPTTAIRSKPDSSLCVAFKMLKNGEADALVSAGSTGAVLVGATLKVGRIKGVSRPALCPILPTVKGDKKVLLLDAGANADCKEINLVQFAIMGYVYSKVVLGTENPKVALLSNGTEDKKGNQLNHDVFPLLKNIDFINFVGNSEAREIMSGDYDVIVADGFSGNIAIKGLEGGVASLMKVMKSEIYSTFKGKIGGLLLKKTFINIKKKMDYNNLSGAVFLGANKTIIKIHGASKSSAVTNAILQAVKVTENNTNDKIRESLEKINLEDIN